MSARNHRSRIAELEAHLRRAAPVGPLDDEAWRHLAAFGHRRQPNGGYGLAYDPAIAAAFAAEPRRRRSDPDLECRQLPGPAASGVKSDLLLAETALTMTARAESVEFPGTAMRRR